MDETALALLSSSAITACAFLVGVFVGRTLGENPIGVEISRAVAAEAETEAARAAEEADAKADETAAALEGGAETLARLLNQRRDQ